MSIAIKVPSVGESISEVFIGEWYAPEGTWVDVDQNVVGLETDKATSAVRRTMSRRVGSDKARKARSVRFGGLSTTIWL